MNTDHLPTAAALEARLIEHLQPSRLEVLDESYQHAGHAGANDSGVGTHFRVRIASHLFTGVSRVARHRLVYDALQDFIDQGLHALAIEAEESSPVTNH
ncbi:BolA family protein [Rhodoferax aquaticus]|uniref:BolA family transcriptional regulator n=1 Tax=Rhodoferax aquaticus TaxID=2527691 RepID=A0A515EPT0_9BURK|nr:BolA family protein [Rhodoferax aquaticus]QDL54667.1 BolA family transcriptional regulator [Rhodoferax aquaticus]